MEADSSYIARKELALPGSRTFAVLTPEFGGIFCQKLERSFVQAFHTSAPEANRHRFSSFTRFLRWASQSPDAAAQQLTAAIRADGAVSNELALREGLLAWRALVLDRSNTAIVSTQRMATRRSLIDTVSGTARRLADVGLWPNPGRLKGVGTSRDQTEEGPSLGELLAPGHSEIEFSFHKIIELNKLRLDRLRELAAAALLDSYTKIALGRELGRKCTFSIPESDADLARQLGPLVSKARKPLSVDDPYGRVCIGLIWAHSWRYRFGRVAPRHDSYRAVLKELGGSDLVRQYIIPSGEVMIAAQTVVLIDSGANISTCEQLPVQCFEAEVVKGAKRLVRFSGVKARAKGRVVSASLVADQGEPLPIKDKNRSPSAVQTIEIWKEISHGFRDIARQCGEDRADLLWIVPNRRGPELIRPGMGLIAHSVLFSRFLERHRTDPILGGLRFSRRTIRKSYLQDRASRKNWSSSVVAALADHRSAPSTAPYLGRKWIRQAYDDLIRQFQTSLQSAFETRIGGDAVDIQRARETGLGFVCLATESERPAWAPSVGACNQVEYCANCTSRSFAPSFDSIKQVLLLNKSLRQCAPELEARNPARWITVWLPYLALTEAIIELLEQSHHKFNLKRIHNSLAQELADGRLQLLQPW